MSASITFLPYLLHLLRMQRTIGGTCLFIYYYSKAVVGRRREWLLSISVARVFYICH
jgi:hypothetical protein